MRAVLLVACLFGILVDARTADACCAVAGGSACGYGGYDLHVTDPSQADDTTPPSAPAVDAEVIRYDQGCGADTFELAITMQATDDRAAAERIGFLITVASGDFTLEVGEDAIVPYGPVMTRVRSTTVSPAAGDPMRSVVRRQRTAVARCRRARCQAPCARRRSG